MYLIKWLLIISFLIDISLFGVQSHLLPNRSKLNCPTYGSVSYGFLCSGINIIKKMNTSSWIECARECQKHHQAKSLRRCKYWSWRSTDSKCWLKTGHKFCAGRDDIYISGVYPTLVAGDCSTTCIVGEWSQWSPCNPELPCGGYSERTSHIIYPSIFPGEICPNKYEIRSCKGDAIRCPSNCPNNDIVTLGWGCTTSILPGGGSLILPNLDIADCISVCKHNKECAAWSFGPWNQTIANRSLLNTSDLSPKIEDGTLICIISLNNIGCFFKQKDWISGNNQTTPDVNNCSIDCTTHEWTAWSLCEKTPGENRYIKTRSREIATYPRNGGKACPYLKEIIPCTDHSINSNEFQHDILTT
ncbi:uncharacterized protein CMU_008690 [Cryptosporidium muris RN66]|uniref:Thrombospondin type 1 domain-containing protein n=1 Tax=Cryptosporidium muris (strain RN66) TaxID=441375 RepID=B6ADT7_CRYMR|nr:uncharacterized protein CMU_008690 [Cryptosporidium muris RN66]EEA06378.1 hypothetical protein, conserved [Cryptosporidium muris RN66]|eukprot:XP_002140727.1 hypothetical protein [Cryptosporidium muris RN66]